MGTSGGCALLLSLASALLADQASKRYVLASGRGTQPTASGSLVRIRPVLSHRTIAGRLGVRPLLLTCAWICCLFLFLVIVPRIDRFATPLAQVALGLALGGAASNLFDVIARKGVVDYLKVGWWPAFNIADAAIVSGVILALLAR